MNRLYRNTIARCVVLLLCLQFGFLPMEAQRRKAKRTKPRTTKVVTPTRRLSSNLSVYPSENVDEALRILREASDKNEAKYGVCVWEVDQPQPMLSFNGSQLLIPASITKLATSAAALSVLSPDFQYATAIGIRGKIRKGVLKGDLVIVGSGDPSIASSKFPQDKSRFTSTVCQALENRNIHAIEGRILVDASLFAQEGYPEHWQAGDCGKYYASCVEAFNFQDNWLRIYLSGNDPDEGSSVTTSVGELPQICDNRVSVVARGAEGVRLIAEPGKSERILTGSISPNQSRVVLKTDMPESSYIGACWLKGQLEDLGIDTHGAEPSASWKNKKRPFDELIGIYYSPKLSAICREMNFVSHNQFAEALIRTLPVGAYEAAPHRLTLNDGLTVERSFFSKNHIGPLSDLQFHDGSGLSRYNRVTAQAFCRMLQVMFTTDDDVAIAFSGSLPRVGAQGTVRKFMMNTPIRMYFKSGSMSGVQCYAGYVFHSGKTYAVCLMANQMKSRWETRRTYELVLQTLFSKGDDFYAFR